MNYSEFEQYVSIADTSAADNFGRYKFKLRLFALLGYLVIIGMIVLVAAALGGLTALAYLSPAILILLIKKKLIFILIPMLWIMIRSLWVKIESPKGYELTRSRFPNVFVELDALSTELDSLKIHTVLLTPEMNAAVVQTPRLGMLGWQKNTLFLGLELMLSLSPEQVRAVVAHELGHLSGNHSKFNGWIYRIRESWARLMNGLMEQDNIGARLMARFFNWYAPRFSAYSFPLARNNEYEADAMAAELTNAQAIGDALINVHVVAPYLEEHYWQNYFKKADNNAKPEILPWAGLHAFLQTNTDPKLQGRLDEAMKIETNVSDTHPALKDRLAALKIPAQLPSVSDNNAARTWLGDQYQAVIGEFDEHWFADNEQPWRERFEYVQKSTARRIELRARNQDELDDETLWELGQLEGEFGERSDAQDIITRYLDRNPGNPNAAYSLAFYKMNDEDDACLKLFEQALASEELAYYASSYAYQYLVNSDRAEEAEWWREKAERADSISQAANAERDRLDPEDLLEKTDLDSEAVQTLIAKLKQSKKVKKAWVAQKVVKHNPEIPAIAIAVIGKGFALSDDSLQKALAEEFSDFPVWIIPKSGVYKPLAKRIIKVGDRVV
ncbi:MAG: M48 family metallopeptidase [Pseudomonadota bacterium]